MDLAAMPYFWQRWWFRLLLVAGVVLSAGAFHRVRVGRLLELERVRSRIAADLHDDIGSSLSQVAVLSEVAHRRAYDTAMVQKHTEKIAVICRELVDSTSDIVWAVSPRHDSLNDLAQRMREFAGEMLAAKDIAFRFEVSPAECRLRMGADMRRQSYLIFKEAVNNAARHSGATEVGIRLAVEGPWLLLSVEDNGRGLGNGKGNGNGLANMRRRAEALRGVFEAGGQSGGARVRVQLPLG
jgi:signal transduction histidine kinase